MIRYEMHGAPSGRVWRFATEFGDGSSISDAMAMDMAQQLGWELHKVADDGTELVLSPSAVEISQRAAEAIADLALLDAESRGLPVPGGES